MTHRATSSCGTPGSTPVSAPTRTCSGPTEPADDETRVVRAVWTRDRDDLPPPTGATRRSTSPRTSSAPTRSRRLNPTPTRSSARSTGPTATASSARPPRSGPGKGSARLEPTPVGAERLWLTSLGAWLELHGQWNTEPYSEALIASRPRVGPRRHGWARPVRARRVPRLPLPARPADGARQDHRAQHPPDDEPDRRPVPAPVPRRHRPRAHPRDPGLPAHPHRGAPAGHAEPRPARRRRDARPRRRQGVLAASRRARRSRSGSAPSTATAARAASTRPWSGSPSTSAWPRTSTPSTRATPRTRDGSSTSAGRPSRS